MPSLCMKGHILLCLEAHFDTELEHGRRFTLKLGMSYQIADNAEPHRHPQPSAHGRSSSRFALDQ